MNQSINKFIKEAKNKINYLSQLKNKVKIQKISYFSGRYFKTIITKKLKQFKTISCVPVIFKKNIKYHITNLEIDHLKLAFEFNYYDWINHINLLMQLKALVYLLKIMNIKCLN